MSTVIIVSSDQETVTLSLVDSKRRLEEARALAAAANEAMFDVLINLDPDDVEFDPDDFGHAFEERKKIERKIARAEDDCEIAWAKYEKALIRYGWEIQQARKAGIVS